MKQVLPLSTSEEIAAHRSALLQVNRMLKLAVLVPILSLGTLGLVLGALIFQLVSAAHWVDHTDLVISEMHDLQKLMIDSETGLRGFYLTGDSTFLEPFERAEENLPEKFHSLESLVSDNPDQIRQAHEIQSHFNEWRTFFRSLESITANGRPMFEDHLRHNQAKQQMDEIRDLVNQFISNEEQLKSDRSRWLSNMINATAEITIILIAFSILFIAGFTRRSLLKTSTVYKEALGETIKSREYFLTVLRSIGDAVIVTDEQGRISFMNSVAESLTGVSLELAKGRHTDEVFKIINHKTREKAFNPVERVLAEGVVLGLANGTILLSDEGTEIPIEDSAAPIVSPGSSAPIGVVLVFRDISDQYKKSAAITEASERLEGVLEGMSDAFLSMDKDWKLTHVNSNQERISGKGRQETVGRSHWEIWPEIAGERSNYWVQYHHVMEKREPVQFEEFVSPLGIWIAVNAYPTRDGGIAVFFRDITETKSAAMAMIHAKEQAESANNLKSSFLANMSHEIRTPLGIILGFADLLMGLHNDQEDERRSFLETLKRNGQMLAVLIDDILDISKVEAGQLKIELLPIAIRELVEESLQAFNSSASEKNIRLCFTISEDANFTVVTDPTRLKQILSNLVGNALKFTQSGSISVSVTRIESFYHVAVRDTGIGIRPEDREKLFKPFSQADVSMTRKFGGTGLGLTLSKKLAHLLGGNLELAESVLGIGSTFVLTFKNHAPHESAPTNTRSPLAVEASTDRKLDLTGLQVLLIEDSLDNQHLIASILAKHGAAVQFANDGEGGVQKALQGNFDIVLMDIQMPVLDGYAATQKLRQQGYRPPIIALSAHAMNEVRQKCIEVGCTDYLPKPLNATSLVRTIEKYTRKKI